MNCVKLRFALPLLIACGPSASARPGAPPPPVAATAVRPPPPARAPFVVAIVVDQFAAWIAEERLPALPKTGGFARLRREGTWLVTVRLPYSVTDTAPGHASLHTGKVPAESGIWGNEVPAAGGGKVTFLRDETTRLVSPAGVTELVGASGARLKVDAFADRLRAAHPEALTISISLKDRGAIIPGGKNPTVALWFDKSLGSFVTSTAFAPAFPAWAAAIADAPHVAKVRSVPWTLSDPAWIAGHVKVPDDAPGEGNFDGYGTTFPHVGTTNNTFRASPAGDGMTLDLALAAVAAEHRPDRPTLLLLSMSSSDIVGHVFGPDSWESWDHLHKLDAALGRFLDTLESRVGPVDVVLSADHGMSSMPETVRARRPASCDGPTPPTDPYERPICTRGARIDVDALDRDLQTEAKRVLGEGAWIAGVSHPYVFLSAAARSLPQSRRRILDDAIRRVFDRRKNALELLDVAMLAARCPSVLRMSRSVAERAEPGEDALTLVCRSWMPEAGAGDFYMLPRLGQVFDIDLVPGKGWSHGGPFLYDRTIPLLVRGRTADPGVVIRKPTDFTVYSEILTSLFGLRPEPVRDLVRK